jgi:hypothetical protein
MSVQYDIYINIMRTVSHLQEVNTCAVKMLLSRNETPSLMSVNVRLSAVQCSAVCCVLMLKEM